MQRSGALSIHAEPFYHVRIALKMVGKLCKQQIGTI